jgi:large subunit ribosomal protein L3
MQKAGLKSGLLFIHMKFLIGKKQEMTQIFAEDGTVTPVTKVVAGPCFVSAKKDEASDGYHSIQLAWAEKSTKNINKPLMGIIKKAFNKEIGFQYMKEFRMDKEDPIFSKLEVGQKLDVSMFEVGDIVVVKGKSKGRGFQGVVKRHGFKGGKASHGHKDQLRMPGSIGATGPARVFKGTKMGGHMGDQSVTVSNLEVIKVDVEENVIYIKGAIPGARNGMLRLIAKGEFEIKKEEVKEKKEEVKKEDVPVVESKEEKKSSDEPIKKEVEVKEEEK